MEIAISIKEDKGLDSIASPIFGRCPYFIFIDPQTKEFQVVENSAQYESGGAGISAAQKMVDRKVKAVISGNFGPKATTVLMTEGIAIYQHQGKTARETLDSYLADQLTNLFGSTVPEHSGSQ